MQRYRVKEVARLSGVSVRTLHHYHEIGLLEPAVIGENRYRYYGDAELLRLQQILFYRAFGLPLSQIAAILDQPDFDQVAALREHRARLEQDIERYRQLIGTIDRTIAKLTGERSMKHSELYEGFPPEQQATYEDWLVETHGGDMAACIDASKQHFADMPDGKRQGAMAELAELERDLAERLRQGVPPYSQELDPLLDRHQAWVAAMWGRDCSPDAYAGLAGLYLSHPDFRQRYETIGEGFADYLAAAMKAHAARRRGLTRPAVAPGG